MPSWLISSIHKQNSRSLKIEVNGHYTGLPESGKVWQVKFVVYVCVCVGNRQTGGQHNRYNLSMPKQGIAIRYRLKVKTVTE